MVDFIVGLMVYLMVDLMVHLMVDLMVHLMDTRTHTRITRGQSAGLKSRNKTAHQANFYRYGTIPWNKD